MPHNIVWGYDFGECIIEALCFGSFEKTLKIWETSGKC